MVGHARSGTTWAHELLTAHPQVTGVFESWLFTTSNGVMPLLAGEAHWEGGALARTAAHVGRRRGLGQLVSHERVVADLRRLCAGWLAEAVGPEHRFLVEKGPVDHYEQLDALFPHARYLHLLRDGRDVAVSTYAASRSWAPEVRPHLGRGPAGAAQGWAEEVRRIRRFAGRVGGRLREFRYEDLRREPTRTAGEMFAFCEIPVGSEQLAAIVHAHDFDRLYVPDEQSFRRAGRIGDWRARFSLLDALRFERAAGGLLRELGYEDDRWWWLRRPPWSAGRGRVARRANDS